MPSDEVPKQSKLKSAWTVSKALVKQKGLHPPSSATSPRSLPVQPSGQVEGSNGRPQPSSDPCLPPSPLSRVRTPLPHLVTDLHPQHDTSPSTVSPSTGSNDLLASRRPTALPSVLFASPTTPFTSSETLPSPSTGQPSRHSRITNRTASGPSSVLRKGSYALPSSEGEGERTRTATEEFASQLEGVLPEAEGRMEPSEIIEGHRPTLGAAEIMLERLSSEQGLSRNRPNEEALKYEAGTGSSPVEPSVSLNQGSLPPVTKSPPAHLRTKPSLILNTSLHPPSPIVSFQLPLSPAQTHWKTVRENVLPSPIDSASSSETPLPPLCSSSTQKKDWTPEPVKETTIHLQLPSTDLSSSVSQRESPSLGTAAESLGNRFRKGFRFRAVADQALEQKKRADRPLEAGSNEALRAEVVMEAGGAGTGGPRGSRNTHAQYLRFEEDIATACADERRGRLRQQLSLRFPSATSSSIPLPSHTNTSANTFAFPPRTNTTSSFLPSRSTNTSTLAGHAANPSPSSHSKPAHSSHRSGSSQHLLRSHLNVPPPHEPLSSLLQVLHTYVPHASSPVYQPFPCSSSVLSELLRPFLPKSPSDASCLDDGSNEPDLRPMALETFMLIVKYWSSSTPADELLRWTWCLDALASSASPLSSTYDPQLNARIVTLLVSLINPRSSTAPISVRASPKPIDSPLAFQILFRKLLDVRSAISSGLTSTLSSAIDPKSRPPVRKGTGGRAIVTAGLDSEEVQMALEEVLGRLRRAELFDLDEMKVVHAYGLPSDGTEGWNDRAVATAVAFEGAVRKLGEAKGESGERELLQACFTSFWPALPDLSQFLTGPSPFNAIFVQAISLLLLHARSFVLTLSQTSLRGSSDVHLIDAVQTKIMPSLQIAAVGWRAEECRRSMMGLLVASSVTGQGPMARESRALIERLCGGEEEGRGWRMTLLDGLRFSISSDPADQVVLQLLPFVQTDPLSACLVPDLVPLLLVHSLSLPPLSTQTYLPLFSILARDYPQHLFQPLFSCASASHLEAAEYSFRLVTTVASILGERSYWLTDADMMAMALVSGAGRKQKRLKAETGEEGKGLRWGKAKVGQLLVLSELIRVVRGLEGKDTLNWQDRSHRLSPFLDALEARLAVLIETREQTLLIPLSHRSLLATLLRSIRTFTESTRSAPWLRRLVTWALSARSGSSATRATSSGDPFLDSAAVEAESCMVEDATLTEAKEDLEKVWGVIALRAPKTSPSLGSTSTKSFYLDHRPSRSILDLLVVVYPLLSMHDLLLLGPELFEYHLLGHADEIRAPAFLVMRAASFAPSSLLNSMKDANSSSNHQSRKRLLDTFASLFGLRYDLPAMTPSRPFDTSKNTLAFAPTDIGLLRWIPAEKDSTMLRFGADLPFSVRSRLAELRWDTDEREVETTRGDWERVPVALLGDGVIERADKHPANRRSPSPSPSPNASPSRSPSPRQEKATLSAFVSSIADSFGLLISSLTEDSNGLVAASARQIVTSLTQEDPTLFTHSIFVKLLDPATDAVDLLLHGLQQIITAQPYLSPALAFSLFNHLGGLLKALSRFDRPGSLRVYGLVVSLMALIAPSLSELSFRDLRKNRIDHLLIPTTAFFFDESFPSTEMFPRQTARQERADDGFGALLRELVVVRTAQYSLVLAIIRRDRKEAYPIKKLVSAFLLPRVLRNDNRSARTHIPDRPTSSILDVSGWSTDRKTASRTLSRAMLLVVGETLSSLQRSYDDRVELARLLECVSELLSVHAEDVLILAQSLRIILLANSRFCRLFSSNSSLALVLPSLFRTYCLADGRDPAIRDAIDYAYRRFASPPEPVIFLTIASVAPVLLHADVETQGHRRWIAKNLFSLLSSLGSLDSADAGVAAGIRDESELSKLGFEPFPPHAIVKLFLTVIASEPSSARAESFLKVLRRLVPHFAGLEASAQTLRAGIEALRSVFSRGRPEIRSDARGPVVSWNSLDELGMVVGDARPVKWVEMQGEFSLLVEAFVSAGGRLSRA